MMIFQKIIDLIELFRTQYLTMEIIQYFFIVQYNFSLIFANSRSCVRFFFKCIIFFFHSSSFLPSSEPARPFPSFVTEHAYVSSNGICRGFAFQCGKFLLPPRFSYGTFGFKSAYPCTVTQFSQSAITPT